MDARSVRAVVAALEPAGGRLDKLLTRIMVRDRCDHPVDFHTIALDTAGAETQRLRDGTMALYPSENFSGFGHVTDVHLACLTAAVRSRHHLGYDPDEKGHHDMELLRDRFGTDPPAPYRR